MGYLEASLYVSYNDLVFSFPNEHTAAAEDFQEARLDVMVATDAYGQGIDKAGESTGRLGLAVHLKRLDS